MIIAIDNHANTYMGSIYGYRHSMKNNAVARKMMSDNEHYIYGLAFAGAHQDAGDGTRQYAAANRRGGAARRGAGRGRAHHQGDRFGPVPGDPGLTRCRRA